MKPPVVFMLKISCSDLERSRAFYAELGFTPAGPESASAAPWLSTLYGVEDAEVRALTLKPPEGSASPRLELIEWKRPAAGRPTIDTPGATGLSVRVEDLDAMSALLARAGGRVVGTTASLAGGAANTRLVNVADPDGLTLQLVEVRRAAPSEAQ